VLDTDVTALDRRAAAAFRGANIGFILQNFNSRSKRQTRRSRCFAN
jgi:ABC-type lipoprotein export system ATPase subunit